MEYDTLLDLCRDRHQRITLAVLADEQRSLTMNALTQTIVEYSHQKPISEISEEALTEIQLSLYHMHIPKLEAVGVIEYDPERQLVEPTNEFSKLQPQLSEILDSDPQLKRPVKL